MVFKKTSLCKLVLHFSDCLWIVFFGFVIQEGLKMLQNQCASWLIAF